MPRYCPAGDGAFDDWVERCPECGKELEDDPVTAEGVNDSDDVVWLTTAPNEPEALMWADSIRATGVPVFVRSGGPGVGAWASASAFEHDLLVRARDLQAARQIVRELLRPYSRVMSGNRIRRTSPVINPIRKR